MNTRHHCNFTHTPSSLIDALTCYTEAGIDPAFNSDMEELERQFAEYRLGTATDLN